MFSINIILTCRITINRFNWNLIELFVYAVMVFILTYEMLLINKKDFKKFGLIVGLKWGEVMEAINEIDVMFE